MAGVCIPINCLVKSSTESLGWCARTHKSQFHIWRMYIVGARFSGKQMLKRSLKPRNGGFSLWYGILSRSISIRNLHLDLRCWGWSVPYPDNARDPWIPTIHQPPCWRDMDIHYPFRISSGLKTLLAMGKSIHFPWVFYLEKMEIFPWLCFSLPKGMISRGWWCGVLESHSLARHQWFFQWIRWLGWRGLKSQLPHFFWETQFFHWSRWYCNMSHQFLCVVKGK